jgi:hypothetical protein
MSDLPPPRLSLTAAASMVCGLLGWLVLPAPVAIVTGIIGLQQTRKPNTRGRGMAMAGLILGVIFGVAGTGLTLVMYRSYTWGIEQVNAKLPAYVNNQIDSATPTPLQQQVKGWGHLESVKSLHLTGQRVEGYPDRMRLTGDAMFAEAGIKPFEVTIEADGDEVRIVEVTFK